VTMCQEQRILCRDVSSTADIKMVMSTKTTGFPVDGGQDSLIMFGIAYLNAKDICQARQKEDTKYVRFSLPRTKITLSHSPRAGTK
jgi:hypothetical protein